MSAEEKLVKVIDAMGYEIAMDVYEGDKDSFFTYTLEDERPEMYGDNCPLKRASYFMLLFFCPKDFNYLKLKKETCKRLFSAGFVYPTVSSFFDTTMDMRRVVFRTHIVCEMEE